jgi:hypothetical protein
MKQKILFFTLLITVFSLSSIFFGCKKEKKVAPIVTVTPTQLHIYANTNDLLTFAVSVNTSVSLSKVNITGQVDNELPFTLLDSSVTTAGTNFSFYYRVPTNIAGKSISITFKAIDENSMSNATFRRVYVAAAPVSQAIALSETAGHLMYSNTSVNHDAYNLETNSGEFSLTADTASRDIQDYSGTNTTLSKEWRSPAGGKFVLYNGFDYANATDSTAISAYTTGVKYSVLYNLAVGDIIITKLGSVSTNKYAVIRITDIVDLAGKDNDYYEFKIKK